MENQNEMQEGPAQGQRPGRQAVEQQSAQKRASRCEELLMITNELMKRMGADGMTQAIVPSYYDNTMSYTDTLNMMKEKAAYWTKEDALFQVWLLKDLYGITTAEIAEYMPPFAHDDYHIDETIQRLKETYGGKPPGEASTGTGSGESEV